MPLYLALCLSLLTLLNGCPARAGAPAVGITITIGDTVPQLSNSILQVYQAADGRYWMGSDTDGLYCVNGSTITRFTTRHGLLSNRIRGIQEDKQGNIYISNLGGINKFNGQAFTALYPVHTHPAENNWKLQEGDLWFSMVGKNGENGPYRYDGTNLYKLQFPEHYLAADYFKRFSNNAWSPYEVYYIYRDSKGVMWFGTGNFGLCRYDGATLSWLYEDHLTNTPAGGSFGIRSVLEDSRGYYWICNTRYRFKIFTDSLVQDGKVLVNYEKENGVPGITAEQGQNHVYFMGAVEDKQGNLWFVTYRDGVWCYNGEKVTHYPVTEGGEVVTLFSIYKDRQGQLWLGTHNNGVYKFNGNGFEKFVP